MIDIATPTPFPTMEATPLFVENLDPSLFAESVAMQGVQWWQQINVTGILTIFQLAILIIIIIAAIVLITKSLNTDF